jgi:hypothetical protein
MLTGAQRRSASPAASTGRQAGTTLGVAISGTVIGAASARGGTPVTSTGFTSTAHGVWWMVIALGVGIVALGLISTRRWASRTAGRAAALFAWVDAPTAGSDAPRPRRDLPGAAPAARESAAGTAGRTDRAPG